MSEVQRKRQRIPLVCQNCRSKKRKCDKLRPSCSYCLKTGVSCVYQEQHTSSQEPQSHDSIESLVSELEDLKRKLQYYQNGNNGQLTPESPVIPTEDSKKPNISNIRINFFEGYNSLSMKKSCHEDHKPLDLFANSKKDPYLIFCSCYMVMILKLNSDIFRENWKTRTMDGMSKWMLLVDTNDRDRDLRDAVHLLNQDRNKLFKMKSFPNITSNSAKDEDLLFIKSEIEKILPSREISKLYLNYFFTKIYQFRPWVDEKKFRAQISDVIKYDEDTNTPIINITKRTDLALIATYLIILRYTYITIFVMKFQDPFDFKLETLKNNPIVVEFITAAQLALSYYRTLRKTSIEIVQALLYLRCYFRDCPEDGDSIRLTQSQNLMGMIVQSAVSIGLNRDPENYYLIVKYDEDLKSLRRRLWYSIIELDVRSVILSGSITTLPERSYWNVEFPDESYSRGFKLDEQYLKLSKLINNLNEDTSLSELTDLLDNVDHYIEMNYPMNGMISIEYLNDQSKNHQSFNLKNTKILSTHLINLAFKAQLFISILLYCENNLHLNYELYQEYFKKLMKVLMSIQDICAGYLTNQFKIYINDSSDFEILPLIQTCYFRANTIYISTLLRLYHCIDLFENTDLPRDNERFEYLKELLIMYLKPTEFVNNLYREHLSKKYFSGLKLLTSARYGVAVLKNYKFQSMSQIIKIFEDYIENGGKGPENPISVDNKKLEFVKKVFNANSMLVSLSKQWTQLSIKTNTPNSLAIKPINYTNFFINHASVQFMEEIVSIFRSPFTYCPNLHSLVDASPESNVLIPGEKTTKIISDAFSVITKDGKDPNSKHLDHLNFDLFSDGSNIIDQDYEFFNIFLEEINGSMSSNENYPTDLEKLFV